MPKPGAWMDTLKQVFAFPIYASAAWLLWVLAQQTSSFGLGAALAGAILIAFAAWAYQKSKSSSSTGRVAAIATAALAVLLAIVLPVRFADVAAAAPGVSTGSARTTDEWQPYDAAQLAKLTAAGRPLLVNFTASWCLTCLVNERNAFTDAAVQQVFRDKGVTLMKGDWTTRDPSITAALAAFGRAGVPLYVVYNSKPRLDRAHGSAAASDGERGAGRVCRRSQPRGSLRFSPRRFSRRREYGMLRAWHPITPAPPLR